MAITKLFSLLILVSWLVTLVVMQPTELPTAAPTDPTANPTASPSLAPTTASPTLDPTTFLVQSYVQQNFYRSRSDCNPTNPSLNSPPAIKGYATGICLALRNSSGIIVGSEKWNCQGVGNGPTNASKVTWSTPDCSGTSKNTTYVALNECSSSLGTSYGAVSYTCPAILDIDNGLAYELSYENKSTACNSTVIYYKGVEQYVCVSLDIQTSQIYSCPKGVNEIHMQTYPDPSCSTPQNGLVKYQEVCVNQPYPLDELVVGYYSLPYCNSNVVTAAPSIAPTFAGNDDVAYLRENFYRDLVECNTSDALLDFPVATKGYAIGVCINLHNNSGSTGSEMYLCPVDTPNEATVSRWNTANCVGNPVATEPIALNECDRSLGTSYGATSVSCPISLNLGEANNDGLAYQLQYDDSSGCNTNIIQYNSIQQGQCVSLDLQTSEIYSCTSGNQVSVQKFYDPDCTNTSGTNFYSSNCRVTPNPHDLSIAGYYTLPYCTFAYLQENYYREFDNCDFSSSGDQVGNNLYSAKKGTAVGVCIKIHNNTAITGSMKYTCPYNTPNQATVSRWNTSDCSGALDSTDTIVLNKCKQSLGTAYGGLSFTCPTNLDIDDGFAYELSYDNSDGCDSNVIEYKGASQFECISNNLQTSQKYSCTNSNEGAVVMMQSFSDNQCKNFTSSNIYPPTCVTPSNALDESVVPYFSRPYCNYVYIQQNYYRELADCDASDPSPFDGNPISVRGNAVGVCIQTHNETSVTGSLMYMCSNSTSTDTTPKVGSLTQWDSPDCSGNTTKIGDIPLNKCSNSIGTSYGAYSYSCPETLNIDNGFAYQLFYDDSNSCNSNAIRFQGVKQNQCIQTNGQNSSIYTCSLTTIQVQSFDDPECDNATGTVTYTETCMDASYNPLQGNAVGYYTLPYCNGAVPVTASPSIAPSAPSFAPTANSGDGGSSASANDQLSGGVISGIVIGSVAIVAIIGLAVKQFILPNIADATATKDSSGGGAINKNEYSSDNPMFRSGGNAAGNKMSMSSEL